MQSRYFMETLNEVRFSEDPTSGPFPNTGVYFVEVSTALLHRVRLASVWLRIEQDVRLGGGDMSHLKRTNGNDDPVFASSAGLFGQPNSGHYAAASMTDSRCSRRTWPHCWPLEPRASGR